MYTSNRDTKRTLVEALSATAYLPVTYYTDDRGYLRRRVLSRKPDVDGEVGESVPLTFKEADRYAWEYENHDGETGITYKWCAQTGYWEDPEEFHRDWNEAIEENEERSSE